MEDLSEMSHLILHDVCIRIVAVQAKNFKFALMLELKAFLASTFSKVIAAKH